MNVVKCALHFTENVRQHFTLCVILRLFTKMSPITGVNGAAEVVERLRADIDIADITRGNRNAFPDSLLQGLSLAD